jgi:hypothetical protein
MTHHFEKGLESEEIESSGVILFVLSHAMTHCRI